MSKYTIHQLDKDDLKKQLELAQCGMSKVRVASCLFAANKDGRGRLFYASNIEIARSLVYHAEELVLLKAINEGYTNPLKVWITSNSPKHRVPMCLQCRFIYFYINPDCDIVVLDEDFNPVLSVKLVDTVNYHYYGQGFIK